MRTGTALLAGFLSLSAAFGAAAGEVADFETRMRQAYASYRAALFATNAGKPDEAAKAIAAFSASWSDLGGAPPPQYADDTSFPATMAGVSEIAGRAGEDVAAGRLGEAHETLEAIRDEIGALHARNGVIGFSDRMNAYHARMEAVIGMADADPVALVGEAAVLDYLARDLIAHRPADADASFDDLAAAVTASVDALRSAAVAGDRGAIARAVGGLKTPYSRLFLKFG